MKEEANRLTLLTAARAGASHAGWAAAMGVAAATLLAACVPVGYTKAPFKPEQELGVAVTDEKLDRGYMPQGVFYDPEHEIVVGGYQNGINPFLVALLPGANTAIGIADTTRGGVRYRGATGQSVTDIRVLAETVLADELAQDGAPQWKLAPVEEAQMFLHAYAVFTMRQSSQARLYAMVKAEKHDRYGKVLWHAFYFAPAREQYPLQGDDGWMKGARFGDALPTAVRRALRLCEDDLAGRLAGQRKVRYKGLVPYSNNEDDEHQGILLRQDAAEAVVRKVYGSHVTETVLALDDGEYALLDPHSKTNAAPAESCGSCDAQ